MSTEGSLALDQILDRVVDDTLGVVPSSAAAVFLLDDDGGLRLRHGRGGSGVLAHLPDMLDGPPAAVSVLPGPGGEPAFLAAPLRARDHSCGVVAVLVSGDLRLTETQRRDLTAIGNRAGELIEAALLAARLERRTGQLQALYRSGLLLTARLDLDTVLQRVADLAQDLLDARYAALGIADGEGVIQQFFTSGISEAERARIGALPQGKGLLGVIIREKQVLRLADVGADPRSAGVPPHHPVMHSFIGMPIRLGDQVLGDLYVTEKRGGHFTEEDESLLTLLANQAAIAIENARLYERVQRLAVFEERERIGMDLHDSVIQSIYAVGLGLEDVAERIGADEPEAMRLSIERSIGQLNDAVRQIRGYIYDLRDSDGAALSARVGSLLREVARDGRGPRLTSSIRSDVADRLSLAQGEALLQVLREALSNARRHAQAGKTEVWLDEQRGRAVLRVHDDGVGFDPEGAELGMGLPNMRERAASVGGTLRLESESGNGSTVVLELPLP